MFSAKQMFTNLLALVGWRQTQKLLASDLESYDNFGWSVSISADGNTLIIGAPNEDTSPYTDNGAAYVFTWDGTTWTQLAKLLASDLASNDYFGYSVSISADGNTAIVGAYLKSGSGASYVFTRSGTTWTQLAKLLASDLASGDQFGYSVSISADGNTAIVGANGNSGTGAAYVFTWDGTTWTQQAKLLASDRALYDNFGYSVAISEDGNTAIVGAFQEDTSPYSNNGAAYVFTRSGSTWTQQAKLLASDLENGDFFGQSVAISADGNTAVIGSTREDISPYLNTGAAYVFTRSGSTWTQVAKLLASDLATNKLFGQSVSISADSNTVIVGANGDSTAYVFTRSGTTWTQVAKLIGNGGQFGYSISINADGDTAIVSAQYESTSPYTFNGAAYIFVNS